MALSSGVLTLWSRRKSSRQSVQHTHTVWAIARGEHLKCACSGFHWQGTARTCGIEGLQKVASNLAPYSVGPVHLSGALPSKGKGHTFESCRVRRKRLITDVRSAFCSR